MKLQMYLYRDLLVHVDGSQAGHRRVQFAVDLAAQMGARLSGLHVTPPAEVPPRYKPSHVAEMAAEISSELALDARSAATSFNEATQSFGRRMLGRNSRRRRPGHQRQTLATLILSSLASTNGKAPPEPHPLADRSLGRLAMRSPSPGRTRRRAAEPTRENCGRLGR